MGESRELVLPGRGTTHCRISKSDPGAPWVVLIHGWTATADLNYDAAVHRQLRGMNVVALDMRGHGQGIDGPGVSYPGGDGYLEDNADDVAAAMDVLGIESAVVVGYSMGTAIAQLLWRRHPERVAALFLGGGAAKFPDVKALEGAFTNADKGLQRVPWHLRRVAALAHDLGVFRAVPILRHNARNDPLIMVQAGMAIAKFDSRSWIGEVDVPTAVMVMENDQLVSKDRQMALLKAIPGAKGYFVNAKLGPIKAGHFAPGFGTEFATKLGAAVRDLAARCSLGLG